MRLFLALLIALMFQPVLAQDASPTPRERPAAGAAEPAETATPEAPLPRRRPAAEPEPEAAPAAEQAPAATPPEDEAGEVVVPEVSRPEPPRVYQTACPAVLLGRVEAEMQPPITQGICVARSPLSVSAVLVNGRMVPLAGGAVLDCGMATALAEWAEAVDGYVAARENTRLRAILSGTSYTCRPRNGAAGADTSEHGFANALDVVGFELEDGRSITLPAGWEAPASPEGRLLRYAHDAGCSHFTTTLGPEANELHRDHLHFDLGCHGKTCTARLCE